MGIECCLRRVETVDQAREGRKSGMADGVRDTVARQPRPLDSFGDGTEPIEHKAARRRGWNLPERRAGLV